MSRVLLSFILLISFPSWAEEGKIIDIGREPDEAYTRCISKEEFNICTAEPEGWDLSLIEKD